MSDSGPIVISGVENVKAVQELTRLHFWRNQAKMKIQFDMTPASTIRAFNEMYDVKAKTWQDVYSWTDATIRGQ